MSRKFVSSGPVKRPYKPRQRKRKFLIYCEGAETEPSYISGLVRSLRSRLVEVRIGNQQGDPKSLVELAKDQRDKANRTAKREKDGSLAYDEVWCVFDVDEHERLPDAIQLATACGINLAISNPCFELWILLHFRDQWAHISVDESLRAVKRFIRAYDKKIDYSWLNGKGSEAIRRARTMEDRALANGNERDNPTSGMWRLVSELCKHANYSIDCL
jgi:RloB-like protein